MHAATGRPADEQRHLAIAEIGVFLHLAGHVLHFFQRRRDEARQANDVRALFFRLRQNFVARHHHAHVHHFVVVALQNHGDDVFANVVHIAFDRGNDHLAFGFDVFARRFLGQLFGLDVGQQMRHRLLHHAGAFHHLRQKHLALTKQVTHHVHAVHQRAFNDVQWTTRLGQNLLIGLFGVVVDKVGNAVHQRMAQALRHAHRYIGRAAPGEFLAVVFGRAFGGFGHLNQALAWCQVRFAIFVLGHTVQHHVLHALAQNGLEVVVNADHARVDDAHVHARLDGVVQKHGVNGFTHRVVAAE